MDQVSKEKIKFAEEAAEFFAKNPKMFTLGKLERGEYFAMRYGIGDDCVVVFRIGDDPINFVQFVDKQKSTITISDLKINQIDCSSSRLAEGFPVYNNYALNIE